MVIEGITQGTDCFFLLVPLPSRKGLDNAKHHMKVKLQTTCDALVNIMLTFGHFVRELSLVPTLFIMLMLEWQVEAIASASVFYLDTCHNLGEGNLHLTTLLCDYPGLFAVPVAFFLHRDLTSDLYEMVLRSVRKNSMLKEFHLGFLLVVQARCEWTLLTNCFVDRFRCRTSKGNPNCVR